MENTKDKLEKILNTLVSKQILDKLNEKELLKLTFKMNDCERYQRINKPDLFQEEIDECIETIKSILDNGKSRLHKKTYNGTGQYNKIKNQ